MSFGVKLINNNKLKYLHINDSKDSFTKNLFFKLHKRIFVKSTSNIENLNLGKNSSMFKKLFIVEKKPRNSWGFAVKKLDTGAEVTEVMRPGFFACQSISSLFVLINKYNSKGYFFKWNSYVKGFRLNLLNFDFAQNLFYINSYLQSKYLLNGERESRYFSPYFSKFVDVSQVKIQPYITNKFLYLFSRSSRYKLSSRQVFMLARYVLFWNEKKRYFNKKKLTHFIKILTKNITYIANLFFMDSVYNIKLPKKIRLLVVKLLVGIHNCKLLARDQIINLTSSDLDPWTIDTPWLYYVNEFNNNLHLTKMYNSEQDFLINKLKKKWWVRKLFSVPVHGYSGIPTYGHKLYKYAAYYGFDLGIFFFSLRFFTKNLNLSYSFYLKIYKIFVSYFNKFFNEKVFYFLFWSFYNNKWALVNQKNPLKSNIFNINSLLKIPFLLHEDFVDNFKNYSNFFNLNTIRNFLNKNFKFFFFNLKNTYLFDFYLFESNNELSKKKQLITETMSAYKYFFENKVNIHDSISDLRKAYFERYKFDFSFKSLLNKFYQNKTKLKAKRIKKIVKKRIKLKNYFNDYLNIFRRNLLKNLLFSFFKKRKFFYLIQERIIKFEKFKEKKEEVTDEAKEEEEDLVFDDIASMDFDIPGYAKKELKPLFFNYMYLGSFFKKTLKKAKYLKFHKNNGLDTFLNLYSLYDFRNISFSTWLLELHRLFTESFYNIFKLKNIASSYVYTNLVVQKIDSNFLNNMISDLKAAFFQFSSFYKGRFYILKILKFLKIIAIKKNDSILNIFLLILEKRLQVKYSSGFFWFRLGFLAKFYSIPKYNKYLYKQNYLNNFTRLLSIQNDLMLYTLRSESETKEYKFKKLISTVSKLNNRNIVKSNPKLTTIFYRNYLSYQKFFFINKKKARGFFSLVLKCVNNNVFLTFLNPAKKVKKCFSSGSAGIDSNSRKKKAPNAIYSILLKLKPYIQKYKISKINLVIRTIKRPYYFALYKQLGLIGCRSNRVLFRPTFAHNGTRFPRKKRT